MIMSSLAWREKQMSANLGIGPVLLEGALAWPTDHSSQLH